MSQVIALVDDDRNILTSVSIALQQEGFVTRVYADSQVALKAIGDNPPDLGVFDIKMPGMDGMELLRRVRESFSLPVIFLTSKDDELDEALGLAMGADDYISKPFSRDELLARIESVLRRVSPSDTKEVIEINGLRIDSASIRVTAKNTPVRLGPLEFRLLRHFMTQPNRVHTRDEIIDRVWRSKEYVDPRAVDVQIRRLRRMLEHVGYAECIQTVRGIGYRFAHQ